MTTTANRRFALPFEKPIADLEQQLADLEVQSSGRYTVSDEVRRMKREIDGLTQKIYSNLTPWQIVQVARHPERPQTSDYLELAFDECMELHGDKAFGDDRAIFTGFAKLGDYKVVVVGHQKGHNFKERNERFFGCAHPEGYRKAMLKMKLAAKYGLPIIALVDTPGAYPGIGAEERGQSHVIARNLFEMSQLPTPIIVTVIGEGGSGGALGIGVGDRIAMLEYAYYSVISPEGCSAILWKSDAMRERAAEVLKLTSKDLFGFGVIDDIVPEPIGGAHRDHREMALNLKAQWIRYLRELSTIPKERLPELRHEKFRRMGTYEELQLEATQKLANEAGA